MVHTSKATTDVNVMNLLHKSQVIMIRLVLVIRITVVIETLVRSTAEAHVAYPDQLTDNVLKINHVTLVRLSNVKVLC